MSETSVVQISPQGRLTLPVHARRRLGLDGGGVALLTASGHEISIVPAEVVARNDAWARTEGHRAHLQRAHTESARGEGLTLSEDDLRTLFALRKEIVAGTLELTPTEDKDEDGQPVTVLRVRRVDTGEEIDPRDYSDVGVPAEASVVSYEGERRPVTSAE